MLFPSIFVLKSFKLRQKFLKIYNEHWTLQLDSLLNILPQLPSFIGTHTRSYKHHSSSAINISHKICDIKDCYYI